MDYSFFGTDFITHQKWCPVPVDVYYYLNSTDSNFGKKKSSVVPFLESYLGTRVVNTLFDFELLISQS